MTSVIVTLDDIATEMGTDLTQLQKDRAQADIDAVTQVLEAWLRIKFTETTILDERHYGIAEVEPVRFNWGNPKTMLGIRWDELTATLYTEYNNLWHAQVVPRGQVYYVSYITDASRVADYLAIIKRIIVNAVVPGLLKTDAIRYGIVNSYSVEGLSISYNNSASTGSSDARSVGPISGTDLSSLSTLRRTLIV